jgi:hypothetical protein
MTNLTRVLSKETEMAKKPPAHIVSKGMILVHFKTKKPVVLKEKIKNSRGKVYKVLGGTAPFHIGSSGRVYVEDTHGFKSEVFPTICDLEWIFEP